MARQVRTVIDTAKGIYEESFDMTEVYSGPNGAVPIRISKRRLYGGKQDGVDVIEVNNGVLSLFILPTRGMGVWRGKCGDVELKWTSPAEGPVHPKFVPLFAPNGIGWLEGFDEFIARCGLESNGAPEFTENGVLRWPLHGRIQNTPAHQVTVALDEETGELTVHGVVEEAGLFTRRLQLDVTYTTYAGTRKFNVVDKVKNRSSEEAEFELLYHLNTGQPFITPGARVAVPFHEMSPRSADAVSELDGWETYLPEKAGRPETCFLFDLVTDADGKTQVMWINAKKDAGLALSFNKKQFPHFLIWKLQRPDGDTYVTALEPCINFPNTRSFEKKNGRVVKLASGAERTFELKFEILAGSEELKRSEEVIQALQAKGAKTIHKTPRPDWCE